MWYAAVVPTVLRIDGLLVKIYPNDHRPEHVHVIGAGKEAQYFLNVPDGPPTLRKNLRFSGKELNRIQAGLTTHLPALCTAWKEIHGNH